MLKEIPAVSVIIPVYGVEAYIERCARSLFEQTLIDIEYIFVDDCTKDASINILKQVLKEYPERQQQVKIIHRPQNGGQAAARATGMKIMTGEYMIHCDPDDWLENDAYEKMYILAKATNADVVTCMFWEENGAYPVLKGIVYTGDSLLSLSQNKYTGSLWDKMILSEIITKHSIYPFEGINFTEDLNVVFRALSYAKKTVSVKQPLYHYDVSRTSSICNSKNYLNNLFNYQVKSIGELEIFIKERLIETGNPIFSLDLLNVQKFWSKWGLYSSHNFKAWSKLWPESHKAIMSFKTIDLKFRIFLRLFCGYPKFLSFIYWLKK